MGESWADIYYGWPDETSEKLSKKAKSFGSLKLVSKLCKDVKKAVSVWDFAVTVSSHPDKKSCECAFLKHTVHGLE